MSGDRGQRPPSRVPIPTLAQGKAAGFRAYTFAGARAVAPVGWTCFGSAGSGGSRVDVSPGTGDGAATKQIQVYRATEGSHAVTLACGAFQSAHRVALQRGIANSCQLIVPPGGRLVRSAQLVKVVTPVNEYGEQRLQYIWWLPKTESAASLTCFAAKARTLGFCGVAYADLNQQIRATR